MAEVLDAPAPTIVAPPAKSSMPPADPGRFASGRATPSPTPDKMDKAQKPTAKSDSFDILDKIAGKEVQKPKTPAPEVKDEPKLKKSDDKLPEDDTGEDATLEEGEEGEAKSDVGERTDDVPLNSDKSNDVQKPEKKPNPWRLADEWKKKAQDAEKKIKELETTPREDPEKVTLKQQLAEQAKREKELSDELKFYNYEAHDKEFKAQFDEPYIEAWHKAVSEIAQFPVTLENDQVRAGTDKDLWKLMNLPRLEAREQAEAMFGKYADDVLGEVSKVRDRFEARTKALTVAKKTIGERQAQRQQQMETAQNEQKAQVSKLWEDANKYALEHPKYGELFRPVEGDQEGNLRLAKGKEMVERAFNEDPNAPNLTPAQRADIVKRHAMIFHRAVAFGRAVAQRNAAMAKLAAIEKELASFKASVPGEGEGRVSRENGEKKVEGMAGALSMLDRLAR